MKNKPVKQILIDAQQAVTKQILIDARKSLTVNGLSGGSLVEYKQGTQDLCFCSLGHIAYVAGIPISYDDRGLPFFDADDSAYEILNNMDAVHRLAEQIEPNSNRHPINVVYRYNDENVKNNPERIIAAFDNAIASCK